MQTVTVRLEGINWETDGEDVSLPDSLDCEVEVDLDDPYLKEDEIFDMAIDIASSEQRWLIDSVDTYTIFYPASNS